MADRYRTQVEEARDYLIGLIDRLAPLPEPGHIDVIVFTASLFGLQSLVDLCAWLYDGLEQGVFPLPSSLWSRVKATCRDIVQAWETPCPYGEFVKDNFVSIRPLLRESVPIRGLVEELRNRIVPHWSRRTSYRLAATLSSEYPYALKVPTRFFESVQPSRRLHLVYLDWNLQPPNLTWRDAVKILRRWAQAGILMYHGALEIPVSRILERRDSLPYYALLQLDEEGERFLEREGVIGHSLDLLQGGQEGAPPASPRQQPSIDATPPVAAPVEAEAPSSPATLPPASAPPSATAATEESRPPLKTPSLLEKMRQYRLRTGLIQAEARSTPQPEQPRGAEPGEPLSLIPFRVEDLGDPDFRWPEPPGEIRLVSSTPPEDENAWSLADHTMPERDRSRPLHPNPDRFQAPTDLPHEGLVESDLSGQASRRAAPWRWGWARTFRWVLGMAALLSTASVGGLVVFFLVEKERVLEDRRQTTGQVIERQVLAFEGWAEEIVQDLQRGGLARVQRDERETPAAPLPQHVLAVAFHGVSGTHMRLGAPVASHAAELESQLRRWIEHLSRQSNRQEIRLIALPTSTSTFLGLFRGGGLQDEALLVVVDPAPLLGAEAAERALDQIVLFDSNLVVAVGDAARGHYQVGRSELLGVLLSLSKGQTFTGTLGQGQDFLVVARGLFGHGGWLVYLQPVEAVERAVLDRVIQLGWAGLGLIGALSILLGGLLGARSPHRPRPVLRAAGATQQSSAVLDDFFLGPKSEPGETAPTAEDGMGFDEERSD